MHSVEFEVTTERPPRQHGPGAPRKYEALYGAIRRLSADETVRLPFSGGINSAVRAAEKRGIIPSVIVAKRGACTYIWRADV
jgi:hypothetical protein